MVLISGHPYLTVVILFRYMFIVDLESVPLASLKINGKTIRKHQKKPFNLADSAWR